MEHNYSLEGISKTFSEHAEMGEQHQKMVNETFLQQNPGQELPEHMKNPFNLPKAFSVICSEIEKLKTSCS